MKKRLVFASILMVLFLTLFSSCAQTPSCIYCKGSGKCSECKGTGDGPIVYPPGGGSYRINCDLCNGTGYCSYCQGQGKVY